MSDYVDHAGDMLSVGYAADETPNPDRLAFETISRQDGVAVELDRDQVWQLQHELQTWLGDRPDLPTREFSLAQIGALCWIGAVLAAVFCAGGMILN